MAGTTADVTFWTAIFNLQSLDQTNYKNLCFKNHE